MQPWIDGIIQIVRDHPSGTFFIQILFFIVLLLAVLGPIYSLHTYYDAQTLPSKKRGLHIAILVFWCLFFLSFSGKVLEFIYDNQISRSVRILQTESISYETYTKAKVAFLDWAILKKLNAHNFYNTDYFQKLYDSTPEAYFKDALKTEQNRRSFATNMSKVGANAEVLLSLWEIENKVSVPESGVWILTTTYRFHLTNKTKINQEGIIYFEAPTPDSVVTELKLGLNGENMGQIAPKWAARRVYEESLVKNIDPALIEKVGQSTYSLRVFPIPSNQDTKSLWRQLIEVTLLSPIWVNTKSILYSPRLSFVNITHDENSSFISKVYTQGTLIKEDITKSATIEEYLHSNHTLTLADVKIEPTKDIQNFCASPSILQFLISNNITAPSSWLVDILTSKNTGPQSGTVSDKSNSGDKVSIFFDNSLSVKRNGANRLYTEIYDAVKNQWGKLNDVDVYAYNFDVHKISEVSDIKFWGYSDIDTTIDYIINNQISQQRIIFVTDDDSFNFSAEEQKGRNLSIVLSNHISVIKVGQAIKSYKADFNSLVAATRGNIYEVVSQKDIPDVLGKILYPPTVSTDACEKIEWSAPLETIYAGYIWNLMMSKIANETNWEMVADWQTSIAKRYKIVNQFNSLIALQTEQQRQDLERYSSDSSKYDTVKKEPTRMNFPDFPTSNSRFPTPVSDVFPSDVEITAPISDMSVRELPQGFAQKSITVPSNANVGNPRESFTPSFSDTSAGRRGISFGEASVHSGIKWASSWLSQSFSVRGSMWNDYNYGYSRSMNLFDFFFYIILLIQYIAWILFIRKYFKKEDTQK